MKITEKTLVTMTYTLTIDSGELVEEVTDEKPLEFITGVGQLVPGVEKQVMGLEPGAEAKFVVAPEDGYGQPVEERIRPIPRDQFPENMDIAKDQSFQADTPHGPVSFVVADINDEVIMADFNHPLAGQNLNFEIKILSAREATDEDVAKAMGPTCSSGEACCGCSEH